MSTEIVVNEDSTPAETAPQETADEMLLRLVGELGEARGELRAAYARLDDFRNEFAAHVETNATEHAAMGERIRLLEETVNRLTVATLALEVQAEVEDDESEEEESEDSEGDEENEEAGNEENEHEEETPNAVVFEAPPVQPPEPAVAGNRRRFVRIGKRGE